MWSFRLVVLGVVVGAAAPAGAQGIMEPAERLFQRGRELLGRGMVAEACDAFDRSHQFEPKVTTLLNLAGCREKQGRLATARLLFLAAEEQTQAEHDPDTATLHRVAVERAFKLETRVSRLTVQVPQILVQRRIRILRNGEDVPAVMWNREVPLDGGTYTIVVGGEGLVGWSTTVVLGDESDARLVSVPVLARRQDRGPSVAAVHTAPVAAQPARRGAAMFGLGAVALGAGAAGMYWWARATYRDAEAESGDQGRRDELESNAALRIHLSQALAVGAVALAGVSVWLYVRDRPESGSAKAAPALRVWLSPQSSGVGVAGAF